MVRRLTGSTLFPYTTLFRSKTDFPWLGASASRTFDRILVWKTRGPKWVSISFTVSRESPLRESYMHAMTPVTASAGRSEEHTSELQSQSNLVCRLLLEKKNI